jgi:hypothetical protein
MNIEKSTSYTSGSWKGVYGQDGEIIANDSTNPPFYATVNFVNTVTPPFTWHAGDPTTDIPGLQKANSNQRLGAAFYKEVPNARSGAAQYRDAQRRRFLFYRRLRHSIRAGWLCARRTVQLGIAVQLPVGYKDHALRGAVVDRDECDTIAGHGHGGVRCALK